MSTHPTSPKLLGLLAACAVVGATGVAHAVPQLSVYIEGATYDTVNKTWVLDTSATSGNITIQAITSKDGPLTGVTMVVSALDDDSFSASLKGEGIDESASSQSGNSSVLNGGDANRAVSYLEFGLGDFAGTTDPIYNYNAGYEPGDPAVNEKKSGDSRTYELTVTGLSGTVIIDAYGYDYTGSGQPLVFAPYSHNGAIRVSSVPELSAAGTAPAAALLLGAAGILCGRRRRRTA